MVTSGASSSGRRSQVPRPLPRTVEQIARRRFLLRTFWGALLVIALGGGGLFAARVSAQRSALRETLGLLASAPVSEGMRYRSDRNRDGGRSYAVRDVTFMRDGRILFETKAGEETVAVSTGSTAWNGVSWVWFPDARHLTLSWASLEMTAAPNLCDLRGLAVALEGHAGWDGDSPVANIPCRHLSRRGNWFTSGCGTSFAAAVDAGSGLVRRYRLVAQTGGWEELRLLGKVPIEPQELRLSSVLPQAVSIDARYSSFELKAATPAECISAFEVEFAKPPDEQLLPRRWDALRPEIEASKAALRKRASTRAASSPTGNVADRLAAKVSFFELSTRRLSAWIEQIRLRTGVTVKYPEDLAAAWVPWTEFGVDPPAIVALKLAASAHDLVLRLTDSTADLVQVK